MRHILLAALLGCLLLSAAEAAGGKTYRWIDQKGRVHYSDVKAEKNSEQIQIRPGSSITAAPKDTLETIASRQLECQRRKDQLAVYSSSAEITETNALGKSRAYTATERQQLLERTQTQADEACSQSGAVNSVTDGNAPRS